MVWIEDDKTSCLPTTRLLHEIDNNIKDIKEANFDCVVINDDLNKCYNDIVNLIYNKNAII